MAESRPLGQRSLSSLQRPCTHRPQQTANLLKVALHSWSTVVLALSEGFGFFSKIIALTLNAGAAKAGPRKGVPATGARLAGAPAHPLAELGGYRMPEGKIGGARGVGVLTSTSQQAAKRKREDAPAASKAGGATEEESKAQAAREAARARVQQRTAKNFGLV